MTLKVGDTIYQACGWNGNVERGNPYPPVEIVGETYKVWILSNNERANKQTLEARHRGYRPSRYVTAEERDRLFWIRDNKSRILGAVSECEDPKVLAEIDAVLTKASAG